MFVRVVTLTCRCSIWFHSGFAFFSIIWVHSCRVKYTHRWFTLPSLHTKKTGTNEENEPFSLRSEPPGKGPPGSSCFDLLRKFPSVFEQKHHPLEEGDTKIKWQIWQLMRFFIFIIFDREKVMLTTFKKYNIKICSTEIKLNPRVRHSYGGPH